MGVETAAQNQSVRVMLTAPCFKWSVRLDLHQHPAGYEPDALLLSYRPMKMVGYPGAAPGVSWSQTKRERLALSYPMKRWTCTPDLHWVMRFCGPLTRLFVLRTK